jgi:hypothetical protein
MSIRCIERFFQGREVRWRSSDLLTEQQDRLRLPTQRWLIETRRIRYLRDPGDRGRERG